MIDTFCMNRRYFGGAPKVPVPPPPPPPPVEDTSELDEIARKRKSLDAARMGRDKLVIPRTSGGLRILE